MPYLERKNALLPPRCGKAVELLARRSGAPEAGSQPRIDSDLKRPEDQNMPGRCN
jgi:hypothetical protein